MINKKGFTLVEVMTVVIVIGILAAVSMPFLIGYSRDARNDRAISILYLVAQGFKNFRSDFSGANVNPETDFGAKIVLDANNTDCDLSVINGATAFDYTELIKCGYIPNINYEGTQYLFYLGGSTHCCDAAGGTELACMIGNDGGNFDENYCAYIDQNNVLHEVVGN